MRSFKLVTLIVLCLCFTQAQANLTNPGFETGSLPPWYKARGSGVEDWNVTTADSHSGLYSATDVGNIELRQDFAAIPVSQIVELSYWLKQPEIAISAFDFFYSDGSGYESIVSLSSSDWEFFDVTSHLSPGKELVGFSVWGYAGGPAGEDRTYLDDVTLETVIPVPGAIVLGGIGVTFVGWLRRRRTV
ncbi:MAG: hypothetical protein JSU70_06045 [Phycisphaerales bacterium]|nr:MAG: hypothetical protein JSU70_06045 [Phycisphaerales bacterium]